MRLLLMVMMRVMVIRTLRVVMMRVMDAVRHVSLAVMRLSSAMVYMLFLLFFFSFCAAPSTEVGICQEQVAADTPNRCSLSGHSDLIYTPSMFTDEIYLSLGQRHCSFPLHESPEVLLHVCSGLL